MQTSNTNSNTNQRRKALGKAFLLVMIPMLFAALGMSLIKQTDSVETGKIDRLEKEILAVKNSRTVFLGKFQRADSLWAVYQKHIEQSLNTGDSLAGGKLASTVEQQEKELKILLGQLERPTADTTFSAVYLSAANNYRALVNNYAGWAKDKKSLRDCRNGLGGEADLVRRIEELEKENFDLRKEIIRSLPSSGGNSGADRELRKLEQELNRCEQALSRMADKQEDTKRKKDDLASGCNVLFNETKEKLEKLKVDGLCTDCGKKEVNKKLDDVNKKLDAIIAEMQTGIRQLLRP